jgi:hypothetical protein
MTATATAASAETRATERGDPDHAAPPGHARGPGTGRGPNAGHEADPAHPRPGRPSLRARLGRVGTLRRLRSAQELRRPSTPFLLRVGMALACVPVVLFAVAVQLGVARNDSTVRTVGRDATRGITVAQAIKLNLAELDEIVVRDLLDPPPLGPGGFPDDYDAKRAELHDNLVLAASESSSGAAYRQPLVNIDYVLAHYHSLVNEAFAASEAGDPGRAAQLYGRAHAVVSDTLLSEADFVDKANTYVLNNTYDRQTARSASTVRLIVVSWVVLLAFLLVTQLLVARKFRRTVNLALAAATVVAAATGVFALGRLDRSSSDLATAREQSFDSVHVLARARATVVSARQAQAQLLLDPGRASDAQAAFDAQTSRLFRVQPSEGTDGAGGTQPADAASLAREGRVPDGAGGYLATVADADRAIDGDRDREEAARRALVAFGDYLADDVQLRQLVATGDVAGATARYEGAEAFTELTDAIDDAQRLDQATFDRHAGAAADAAAHVDKVTLGAAAAVLVLVGLGLYQRLREYRT